MNNATFKAFNEKKCQLHTVSHIGEPLGTAGLIRQLGNRLRRIFKRRWHYCEKLAGEKLRSLAGGALKEERCCRTAVLAPGDLVRVRPRAEIEHMLDRWGATKGCVFLEEMWQYCDTTQRVFKRMESFLDERDYRVKKCRNIVLLENVLCCGTVDFGACDRSCFYFWRTEWLEKIEFTDVQITNPETGRA